MKKPQLIALSLLFIFIAVPRCGQCPDAAEARVRTETRTIPGSPEPHTPEALNRVGYTRYFRTASSGAPGVILVLVSGYASGAGYFDRMARSLAERGGLEVWAVNRRETLLEDRAALNHDIETFMHHAEARPGIIRKMNRSASYLKGGREYLRYWGFRTLLGDIREVVRRARQRSGAVVLGGWSDGVEFVMAYAHYRDERGNAAAGGLRGLVFLDENPEWGRYADNRTEARKRLARHERLMSQGGLYMEYRPSPGLQSLALALAAKEPHGRSPLAGAFNLPAEIQRRGITNRALTGWLYEWTVTGHPSRSRSPFAWMVRAGDLTGAGTMGMYRWKGHRETGEYTDIARYAGADRGPGRLFELFYPGKLLADYWRISLRGFNCPEMGIAPSQDIRLPVFYVLSGLNNTGNSMPSGMTWFMAQNGIQRGDITILRKYNYAHSDIFFADRAPRDIYGPLYRWLLRLQ
ncbi:MAG TPA: hypothetical protein PK544_11040 [Spirochaetota bacterium]|nr:hypothetical protein [Spirochaetota bacterium]